MTVRVPKFVLIGLGLIALMGAGAAAYLTVIKSDETCSSTDWSEIDCGDSDAITEDEYAEYKEEQERERQAQLEAEQAAARCEEQLAGTSEAANELDSRL
jgi:hypothetical protein